MDAFLSKTIDVKEFARLVKNRPFSLSDIPAYIDAVKGNLTGTGIDDRKMLLEKALVLMSRLGAENEFATRLQELVIDLLYKDLPHPPSSYLALPTPPTTVTEQVEGVNYAYRSADGSNYNPLLPNMGRAKTPYARSVSSANFIPASSLPDPGLVFDTLLKRDKFTPHPGGISSLFFAFADLIIHSCFYTDHRDWSINNTSSYLDLSILYGNNAQEVESVRKNDGTGQLHNDVFADSRLLFMPPSACALLVLLSRNHNYIAKKLLDINERGTFQNPPPQDPVLRKKQDNELFHRARLVNCGYFMQIILGDYVGSILGLVRDGYSWRLNPLKATRGTDHEVSPRGEGNVCAIEFNLLYRWHATLSERDTKWTEEVFKGFFPGKGFSEITTKDFTTALRKKMVEELPRDVKKWTFDGLKRGPDGCFNDDDLAKILLNATDWSASSFGARGTPEVLRVIEIMGIEQSRSWGTCSINEFRKFIGLKPYANFKEWNRNEAIANAAEALYKDINNLELHVGLQAEESKPAIPGAGLCPGYTISRAILADAVCLTRGDRFLTTEMTPYNFTSWGFQDCQFDTKDGSYGGMLTKLLFRTLPNHYPAGSAYAHFPFLVPSFMKKNMQDEGNEDWKKYTWERPSVPKGFAVVDKFTGVSKVLAEPQIFRSPYDTRLANLTSELSSKVPAEKVEAVLMKDKAKLAKYFSDITTSLIKEKTTNHVGSSAKYVDIVGDVINLVPVYWIAREVIGIPLTTDIDLEDDDDVFEIKNLYKRFADVCEYVYLNFIPDDHFKLRESAQDTYDKVANLSTMHLAGIAGFSVFDRARHVMNRMKFDSHAFLTELQAKLRGPNAAVGASPSPKELAAALFVTVVPTAAHFSQAVTHVVNFYLDDKYANDRAEIVRLVQSGKEEDIGKVMQYVREALRVDPLVSGVYRTATKATDLGSVSTQAGDTVFASIVNANLDPNVFGESPLTPNFNRPREQAGIFSLGEFGLLSSEFFEATVPGILAAIFSVKSLSRGPGKSGQLKRFKEDWHGTPSQHYINTKGEVTPFPDNMVVSYSA